MARPNRTCKIYCEAGETTEKKEKRKKKKTFCFIFHKMARPNTTRKNYCESGETTKKKQEFLFHSNTRWQDQQKT